MRGVVGPVALPLGWKRGALPPPGDPPVDRAVFAMQLVVLAIVAPTFGVVVAHLLLT